MVAIDSALRRAGFATVGMWLPCAAAGAWLAGPLGAGVAAVGMLATWIAVRLAARATDDRTLAIATALWAAPCGLVGVPLAMLVAFESMDGGLRATAAVYVIAMMLVAAAVGAAARRLALGRVGAPTVRPTRRPLPRAVVGAIVIAGVVAFDVLTGVTMATDCVTDGSCAVGIPLRIAGSTTTRLLALVFDLAVFMLPALWISALRSSTARHRAIGRIGVLVTVALLGTALASTKPRWFGYRVWSGDRIDLVLGH